MFMSQGQGNRPTAGSAFCPKLGFMGRSEIGFGGRTHGDCVSEGQPVKAQGNEALKWTSYIYGAYLYILSNYKV